MKFLLILFLFSLSFAKAETDPKMRSEDRIRIAEAFKISEQFGGKLWNGWNNAPFPVLLVTDEYEFLVNHPSPSEDFRNLGYDSLLKGNVYLRKRQFPPNLLAAFPAVGGISTVVAGIPENTKKNSAGWIITLLHEHFHQLQTSYADYYSAVNSLGLSRGDESGMWMLNFPFSYSDENVNGLYDIAKKQLALIFKISDSDSFGEKSDRFRKFFAELVKSLPEDDKKYFTFQLWQEGIARYTELKLLQMMESEGYEFSEAVQKLEDHQSLKEFSREYFQSELNLLNGLSLRDSRRNCFYSFGAFIGLLLDQTDPSWKERYFEEKFLLLGSE